MRKKILVTLLCGCLALCVGCNADEGENKNGNATKTPQKSVQAELDEFGDSIMAEGIYFELNDEYAVITGYEIESETTTLPDAIEYDGKSYIVKEIADEAFSGNTTMKEVVLPQLVESIGVEVFYGCTALEKVEIPDSVTMLDKGAFYDCTSLKEVKIGAGVQKLSSELFTNCYALEKVELSDKLVAIDTEVFWDCESLKELELPASVVTIGDRAFYGAGLEKLTISSPVASISEDTLEGVYDLKQIYVDQMQVETTKKVFQHSEVDVKGISKN